MAILRDKDEEEQQVSTPNGMRFSANNLSQKNGNMRNGKTCQIKFNKTANNRKF
jgi:hypothetical protein